MKKIYYLNQEVRIGEVIDINGVTVKVTNGLIKNNPDLFNTTEGIMEHQYFLCIKAYSNKGEEGRCYKLEETDDLADCDLLSISEEVYYLSEAKRRYPVGSVVKYLESDNVIMITEQGGFSVQLGKDNIKVLWLDKSLDKVNQIYLYSGCWAEIAKPIAVFDDGTYLYYGDIYFFVDNSYNISYEKAGLHFKSKHCFPTRGKAEEWVRENKVKDLNYYESCLRTPTAYMVIEGLGINSGAFFNYMKLREPKLYYLKVLQMITDDLNKKYKDKDKWVSSIIINTHGKVSYIGVDSITPHTGETRFTSKEAVEEAIKIMGDSINYLK